MAIEDLHRDDDLLKRDPALDPAHEHTHGHLHHGAHAAHSGNDQPVYTIGTTDEPSVIPDPERQDHLHRRHNGDAKLNEKTDGLAVSADVEKGGISPISTVAPSEEERDPQSHKWANFYAKYRIFFHLFFWLLMTGWWIAGLVLHRPGTAKPKNWVIPFLLWLAITIRLVTFHVSIDYVMKPVRLIWKNTAVRALQFVSEKARVPSGAAVTIAVIIVGAFASEETADNTRANRGVSLFGLAVCLFVLWATSKNRKAINWHTIIMGMLVQFIIALFVLRTQVGYDIFNFISTLARLLLSFAGDGLAFLTSDDFVADTPWFLISVIPAIIFFVALVQLLYYWNVLQWAVGKFAVFFFWSMRVTGAEAVVAAATPFIGQGESAMLIRPFVPHLTKAELHQIMACGFATIAGSVLVAYISMGLNPQALVSSCIMSIPASLAMSHLRYPETEETLTAGKVVVPDDDEHKAANSLHAFANGAWLGLKIAAMICGTLLVIIALLNLVSGFLTWWGRYLNLTGDYDLTVELIVGYICYPIAWLLGVPKGPDLIKVARLIGIKIVAVSVPVINFASNKS